MVITKIKKRKEDNCDPFDMAKKIEGKHAHLHWPPREYQRTDVRSTNMLKAEKCAVTTFRIRNKFKNFQ